MAVSRTPKSHLVQRRAGTTGFARETPNTRLAGLAEKARNARASAKLDTLQRAADKEPLQLKKTQPMDMAEIARHGEVWPHMRVVLGPARARTDRTTHELGATAFNKNLQKGRQISNKLDEMKAAEQDDPVAAAGEQADRGKAASKLYKNYKTKVRVEDPERAHEFALGTKGKGGAMEAYSNRVSTAENSITTIANYGSRDPNRPPADAAATGKRKHLNNSEIFWQQWKAAVKADISSGRRKNSRRKAKVAELSKITRHGIVNPYTLLTVHQALPNDQAFSSDVNVSFGPGSDEFLALLGTPNGRGVGFLLQQHYHEMDRKSFGNVDVIGAGQNLTFNFV